MKTWKKTQVNEPRQSATGLFSYLNEMNTLLELKNVIKTIDDALNIDILQKALAVRAIYHIKSTMTDFLEKAEKGHANNELVNSLYA